MKYLRNLWIFFPAIPFYCMALKYVTGLPNMDDYEVVLQTVLDIKHGDFWGTILRQHNEHRPAIARLIFWLYYSITGGVNFRILTLMGDLLLMVPAILGAYFIRKTGMKYWKWAAFVWCLLLFDLNTFEANDWCMVAWSSYGTIALFFLAIYFCGKPYWWLGLLCQFLMIYSNGNGMVGAIVVCLYVIAKYKNLVPVVSGFLTLMGIGLYFIGYSTAHAPMQDDKLFSLDKAIPYFIQMTGAPINFDWSLLFGILILSALVFFWRKTMAMGKKWWPIMAILYFCLLTMGTATVFRSNMVGAQFQTSRYLVWPQMLLAIVFIMFLNYWKKPVYKVPAIVTAMLLICYYFNFQFGIAGYERYQYREANMKFYHPDQKKCEEITKEACDSGVYCIDDHR
jgi:hypothetical protein